MFEIMHIIAERMAEDGSRISDIHKKIDALYEALGYEYVDEPAKTAAKKITKRRSKSKPE